MVSVAWRDTGIGHGVRPQARLEFDGLSEPIQGDFDTGADLTLFPLDMMEGLGVSDGECVPISISPLGRQPDFGRLAMLKARLDGHDFRCPVAFAKRTTVLFGRPGLVDQYLIELDPRTGESRFTWVGAQEPTLGAPWSDYFEERWQLRLNQGLSWQRWQQAKM